MGLPSDSNKPREWSTCLAEGKSHITEVTDTTEGDVMLNLIGHSRGAVLCMWLVQEAYSIDRVTGINIIAFDPIPGDTSISNDIYAYFND